MNRELAMTTPQGGTARANRLERGFSLIELMIAITILGVGILSLAGLFPIAMQKVSRGDLESRATFHAQAKIEEIKRMSWNSLTPAVGGTDNMETMFNRTWTVQQDVPVVGMKQVDVVVTWNDNRGVRTVSLSSFLSDSGM
ncbi:MAG: prepilin-type N-terminal cleavage/methylation domain-containing protein [Phycisphaerales bacterium]|nr:prepilin-type N-terminal cleavage/methylation domain-containing protein [Phycisphaerales bacterium]